MSVKPVLLRNRMYLIVFFVLLIHMLTASKTLLAQSSPGVSNLPTGFVDEVVVPGLLAPRAFTFTPDGRILILERGTADHGDLNFASVRVFENGQLLATRALTLNTCGDSERGALGIEVDNSFSTTGYVYIYYTRQAASGSACPYNYYGTATPGTYNRVSRFTMMGNTINPDTERVLIDNIVTNVGYHNAGDLHMDTNGYLYISTGDGGISELASATSSLNGKILRILPSQGASGGYATTGNPYHSSPGARNCGATPPPAGTGPCREIFAIGFRNPFRFTLHPTTNMLFAGDVGGGIWEEIDQVVSGGNYGWPLREGPCDNGVLCSPPYTQPPGMNNPIHAYPHSVIYGNVDSAIIGGAFYTGDNYPPEYEGNYFYTDAIRGFIRRLEPNGSSWTPAAQDFATDGSWIIGLKEGPNGDLYYITFTSESVRVDSIHRIRYLGGANVPPTAHISITTPGTPGDPTYTFSAAGSFDPDSSDTLTYTWNFGDGSPLEETTNLTVSHTFAAGTNRTVSLTAKDADDGVSAPVTITVYPGNNPATGEIVLTNLTDAGRGANSTYFAGDQWQYALANTVDPDGPALPNSAYNWSVVFHHQDHTHPFLPSMSGTTGNFTIPVSGETDPVVWYRVILRITDARGETTIIERDVDPITAQITLTTNPPGGQISLEGGNFPTPKVVTRVVGLRTTVGVPSPQTIGGIVHQFVGWSDSGPQTHTITVPPVNTTYTTYLSPGPLSAPLISPGRNYYIVNQATLSWARVSWAVTYQVEVDNTSNFSTTREFSTTLPTETFEVTTSSLANGIYYWRVRACPATGACGAWSKTESFVVNAPS